MPKQTNSYPSGGREHLPYPDKFVPTANTPADKVVNAVEGITVGVPSTMEKNALSNLGKNFIRQGPQHRYGGDMEDANKQSSL